MRVALLIGFTLFAIVCSSDSAYAKNSCPWFFKNLLPLFRSPSSNEMIRAPEKIPLKLTEGKMASRKVELADKGPEQVVVSTQPMNQVNAGSEDEWSRISKSLDRQGTALVTYRNRFGPKGAFVDLKVKGSSKNQNGVIILNSSTSKNRDLRAVLGHEAYHAKMQAKRANGETDLFNSEFFSKTNSGGTYDQYISSEEIHAWSKEFNQSAIKANNRETMKLINEKISQNQPVRIKASTVVSDQYSKLKKEYEALIETHDRFIHDVAVRIDSGDFKLKFDDLNRVIIETEAYDFKPGNYLKLLNGSANIGGIRKEIDQLIRVNQALKKRLQTADHLIQKGNQQGYYTAEEYIRLKNEVSGLGGAVTQPSP